MKQKNVAKKVYLFLFCFRVSGQVKLIQVIEALRKKDQLIETITFKLLKGGANLSMTSQKWNIQVASILWRIKIFLSKKHTLGKIFQNKRKYHSVKSVQIRSFFWSVFYRIRIECGEIPRIWTLSTQCTGQRKPVLWHILGILYKGEVLRTL